VISRLSQTLRVLMVTAALLVPLAGVAAPTAVGVAPCWVALLNDWYDGRIDSIYEIHCYQEAIDHLPQDVQVYSSARDDIDRALQLAIAHEKNSSAPKPTITHVNSTPTKTVTATTTKTTTTTPKPAKTTATTATTETEPDGTTGNQPDTGPVPSALDSSSPGGATSFPLPLLILGGLALLLLAAGVVGLIVRRMQGRGGPPNPA
jgi:cobalamin biosynthesis Mg chelatase CobN